MGRWCVLVAVVLTTLPAHAAPAKRVGPSATSSARSIPQPVPAYFGNQPMQNFHDLMPPFGMSYQPLHQLPPDHPANQMGKRQHLQWGGFFPQEWNNPLPHNSPVDPSRLVKKEENFPGRAVAPFWWNEPPWWWKEGPWWMQKVKKRADGRPYGVLGNGPEAQANQKLPSPLQELDSVAGNGSTGAKPDAPTPLLEEDYGVPHVVTKKHEEKSTEKHTVTEAHKHHTKENNESEDVGDVQQGEDEQLGEQSAEDIRKENERVMAEAIQKSKKDTALKEKRDSETNASEEKYREEFSKKIASSPDEVDEIHDEEVVNNDEEEGPNQNVK